MAHTQAVNREDLELVKKINEVTRKRGFPSTRALRSCCATETVGKIITNRVALRSCSDMIVKLDFAITGNASESSFWHHSFNGPSTAMRLVRARRLTLT